jgi:diguanylate cyclase (GGDEF)-like protein
MMNPSEAPRFLVLIVDDEPSTVDLLAGILKEHYEIACAASGEEALQFCEQRVPDLVLLDVAMPGVDGHEVCRRLKTSPRTDALPVIFVTAHDSPEDEIRGLDAGAVDFIAKPVHPAIVLARVRTQITLKCQADQLRGLALTDALTGVANRRAFEAQLDREWRRCQRNKLPLSVIIIDIDHFKKYNDTYGHQAGDHCLQHVASTLAMSLRRAGDTLGRYGGEEFACLLPATDLAGATARAEDIGRAIERLNIVPAGSANARVVTVSRGVGTTIPDDETEILDLLEVADAMLYQAKRAGRNCTRACLLGQGGNPDGNPPVAAPS